MMTNQSVRNTFMGVAMAALATFPLRLPTSQTTALSLYSPIVSGLLITAAADIGGDSRSDLADKEMRGNCQWYESATVDVSESHTFQGPEDHLRSTLEVFDKAECTQRMKRFIRENVIP